MRVASSAMLRELRGAAPDRLEALALLRGHRPEHAVASSSWYAAIMLIGVRSSCEATLMNSLLQSRHLLEALHVRALLLAHVAEARR